MKPSEPFWKRLQLEDLSETQWESLCDGCGRCCLEKMINKRTGKVYYTDVVCPLFDPGDCRCGNYANRSHVIPDCISLKPSASIRDFRWLPRTCAYRLLAEGRDLAWWHPLVSGRPESVHEAGISLKGKPITPRSESTADLDSRIVHWGIWAKSAGTDV